MRKHPIHWGDWKIMMELVEKLKNSYRKFKSQVYFQNSHSFKKIEIANFENDKTSFDNAFSALSFAIDSKDNRYFNQLISKIDTIILPKKIEEKNNDPHLIVNKTNSSSVEVNEVNFFLKAPIELYVVDVYYTILIADKLNELNVLSNDLCYANKFHRDLFDGIGRPNFQNLNLFSYYFTQYKKWKNDAISYSENLYKKKQDSSIISLDITGYYYFIDAKIKKILDQFDIVFDDELLFLTKIIQKVFSHYSKVVSSYRKDLINKVFLPIGLNISCLLSNLYLSSFDKAIRGISVHYGRYVDDVIIVIDNCKYDSFKDFAHDNPSILKETYNGDVVLTDYPDLIVKKDKCRIIKNFHDGSSEIFSKLKTEERTISEYNLFPSFNANVNNIINDVYEKQEYIKFRDFHNIQIDQGKIGKTISGLITTIKGTKIKDKKAFNNYSNNLLGALSPAVVIMTCMKMERLMLLFGYLENMKAFGKMKSRIKNTIKHVKFCPNDSTKIMYGDGRTKNRKAIETKMRESLMTLYRNGVCCFGALTGNLFIGKEDHITSELVKMYRYSNLFDIGPVKYPLINFTKTLKTDIDYRGVDFEVFVDATNDGYDTFRIQYSPYYINISDYLWAKEISNLVIKGMYAIEELYDAYHAEIGIFFGYSKEPFSFKRLNDSQYQLTTVEVNNNPIYSMIATNEKRITIAVGSINLDMMRITAKSGKGKKARTILNDNTLGSDVKSAVIRLLNDSYYRDFGKNREYLIEANKTERDSNNHITETEGEKRPVDYILFPESFLPFSWIKLIDKFSRETQSTIVTGIRYVVYKKTVFNLVATEIPYFDSKMHKQSIVVIREKNIMPLKERNILHDSGYKIRDKDTFDYILFKKDGVNFAPLICYEATDIDARSLFKNRANYIFTIAFNQDVNYFNSIGMSTSRDLFCFYIECNSSKYGSNAYAPYKNKFIPIASDKGNAREHMQIVFTNLRALNDYKKGYFDALVNYDSYDFTDDDPKAINDKEKSMFKKPSGGLFK